MSDTFDHEGDAWDSLAFDDCQRDGSYGFRYQFAPRAKPTCSRCGKQNLTWHHTGERWALMNADGRLHTCTPAAASADDFDDLTKRD